jgi:hypothetical protein
MAGVRPGGKTGIVRQILTATRLRSQPFTHPSPGVWGATSSLTACPSTTSSPRGWVLGQVLLYSDEVLVVDTVDRDLSCLRLAGITWSATLELRRGLPWPGFDFSCGGCTW